MLAALDDFPWDRNDLADVHSEIQDTQLLGGFLAMEPDRST